MAKQKEIIELPGDIEIPSITPGATAGVKPHLAKPDHNIPLGFPGELLPDWEARAVAKLGELLGKYKSLRVYLDVCVKCGSCTDKCQFFLGTGDPRNMPVARQDLLRKIYRKYFTPAGKLFPSLVGAEPLTRETLDEWYAYYHQCSQCRRCAVYCPYGIDTAEISMAAREIMDSIGYGQKYCNEIIGKVHQLGNNLGIPKPALLDTLSFLEEDIKEDTGADVKLPLDVEGAEVLMIVPSADFFSSPHVDSLVGYAKVFHQAGVSWTLSSQASEFANFGMFIGNYEQMRKIAQRIADEAKRLKVKRLVVGECGHAYRVAYQFWNTLVGPFDYLDNRYKQPTHICEFTNDLIERGALKLDKSANDEFTVTFHDSCNIARASRMGDTPGGQFEIPRQIIKATCNKFVDMPKGTIREETFCCGGGGGLLTDELMDIRVKGMKPRATALKHVIDKNEVNYMALICAICKAQFSKVLPYYGIPMDVVGGIHQLVSRAIVLGGKE